MKTEFVIVYDNGCSRTGTFRSREDALQWADVEFDEYDSSWELVEVQE